MCIEGEEDFADQLKEYHGYCESLRHICKKQELLQLELEQCEDALESRKTERENLSLGKTGLLGKLMEHSQPMALSTLIFMYTIVLLLSDRKDVI